MIVQPAHPNSTPPSRSWSRRAATVAMLLGIGLLLYGTIIVFAPPSDGIPALGAIFLPHLMLAWLVVAPLALLPRTWLLRFVLLAMFVVLGVGVVPEQAGRPVQASPDQRQIKAVTWNLLRENHEWATILRTLIDSDADIVGIQELSFEHAAFLEGSPDIAGRYPHRILRPDSGYLGLALLSRLPIQSHGAVEFPPVLWGTLDRGNGESLNVIVAHPLPARFSLFRLGPTIIPFRFNPSSRDAQLARVRVEIDRLLVSPSPLIVLGDFNVTSREYAYRSLTRGLTDVHESIAFGTGNSFMLTFFGLEGVSAIRIDYIFTGPGVVPLSMQTDCSPRGSDHCLISGVFGFDASPPSGGSLYN